MFQNCFQEINMDYFEQLDDERGKKLQTIRDAYFNSTEK
jgi:hypothetical protein